ncbi:MAG: hypothetical protein V3U43_01150, partial [Pseudomonadales bacterium]
MFFGSLRPAQGCAGKIGDRRSLILGAKGKPRFSLCVLLKSQDGFFSSLLGFWGSPYKGQSP